MRIPYTKILDDEKTECVVFFNDNERIWFYIKKELKTTFQGERLDDVKTSFSNVGSANFSNIKNWADFVEYYVISKKHYELLRIALGKVAKNIDNRKKYLSRIRNSFVEL